MDILSGFAMIFAFTVFLAIQKYHYAEHRSLNNKKKHSFSMSIPVFGNSENIEKIIRGYLIDNGYNLLTISEQRMVFDKKSTLAKSGNWIIIEKSDDVFSLKLYFKFEHNIVGEDFNTNIAKPLNYLLDKELA